LSDTTIDVPLVLALGNARFTLASRPTIRQGIDILLLFVKGRGLSGGDVLRNAAEVVHAALVRDNPTLTLDQVLDTPATLPELTNAIGVIAEWSGVNELARSSTAPAAPMASA